MSANVQLESTLTCPACGVRITPNKGDCCVFCSYGSLPCPPVQLSRR